MENKKEKSEDIENNKVKGALAVLTSKIILIFSTFTTIISCIMTNKRYTEAYNILHFYILSEK